MPRARVVDGEAALRLLVYWIKHPELRGSRVYFGRGTELRRGQHGRILIGSSSRFARDATISVNGLLEIGEDVFFNRGAYISVRQQVVIGAGCRFGERVSVHDEDHRYGSALDSDTFVTSPVTIGRNVWVGAASVILKGVTIGDGAVVGAGSVVVKDVAPQTLVGGVPARFLRHLDGGPQNAATLPEARTLP